MKEKALIVFAKNPISGNVKSSMALETSDVFALEIHCELFIQALKIATDVWARGYIFFSDFIPEDKALEGLFDLRAQKGTGTGGRMLNAFREALLDCEKAVLIGTDCFALAKEEIERAFEMLMEVDIVIGPGEKGGIYLLGMKAPHVGLFKNNDWGQKVLAPGLLLSLEEAGLTYQFLSPKKNIELMADVPHTLLERVYKRGLAPISHLHPGP